MQQNALPGQPETLNLELLPSTQFLTAHSVVSAVKQRTPLKEHARMAAAIMLFSCVPIVQLFVSC
jgi:hypothetical protein